MSYSRTPVRAVFTAFTCWLIGSAAAWSAEESAYALLERLGHRYQQADSYHDRGTVEWLDAADAAVERAAVKKVGFETWKEGSAFRLELTLGDPDVGEGEAADEAIDGGVARRVIWQDETGIWQYDSGLEQIRPRASLVGAVSSSLGEHGLQALPVALALAGSSAGFEDVEAASFDGRLPCGDATCDVLIANRMAGTISSELWIDRESSEVRQIVITSQASILSLPWHVTGREVPLPDASSETVLRVTREVLPTATAADFAFTPPDQAVFATAQTDDEQRAAQIPDDVPIFGEEITVRLLSFRIRTIDLEVPPTELTPENFRVTVGSTEIPVQALDWSPAPAAEAVQRFRSSSRSPRTDFRPGEGGRQVIYFLQAANEADRIAGHLRMKPYVAKLLDSFSPADRVAVVSFDSHLKIWRDLLPPDKSLEKVIEQANLFGGQPFSRRSDRGPLAKLVDRREALDAATPEQALGVIAKALERLQGERVLIWQGWGMGVYTSTGVKMTPDYRPAIRSLRNARTAIFVLDISTADHHSLELGLKNAAADTGGRYFSTFRLPGQATRRLGAALAGHFVLTLDGDLVTEAARQRPKARLKIRLRGVDGEIVGPPLPLY